MRLIALIMMLLTTSAYAQKKVAVLPVQAGQLVTSAEQGYLTKLLRGIAGNELNAAGFVVIDKENFQTFLGADVLPGDCLGSCAVDTGVKLQAHYVVSAEPTKVFGSFGLTLSAHNTKTRAQVKQVVIKIKTKPEFESRVETEAPALFRAILRAGGGVVPRRGAVLGGAAPSVVDFEIDSEPLMLVKFRSQVSDVMVSLNGTPECETPCQKRLSRGIYTVQMSKVGYVLKSERVMVEQNMTLDWHLARNVGTLKINSTDGQSYAIAVVGKDGPVKDVGQTPAELQVKPGMYTVSVGASKCTVPHKQRLLVRLNETVKANFTPAILPAGLFVNFVDSQGSDLTGEVYSSRGKEGHTFESIKLPVCSKGLEVRSEKYGIHPIFVTLKPKQEVIAKLSVGTSPQFEKSLYEESITEDLVRTSPVMDEAATTYQKPIQRGLLLSGIALLVGGYVVISSTDPPIEERGVAVQGRYTYRHSCGLSVDNWRVRIVSLLLFQAVPRT